jgi:hypothetical protein
MNDEEQVPQAGNPAGPAGAEKTPVEQLEDLGVRGILRPLARDGQIIDVRCEMPQCYFPGSSVLRAEIDGFRLGADGGPLPEAQGTEVTSPRTTSGSRIGSATDVGTV